MAHSISPLRRPRARTHPITASRCTVEPLEARQLLSAAVNLSANYNRTGIVVDYSKFATNAGFDGGGNGLSSTLLGTSKTWNSSTYTLGTTGHANVVTANGQTITLPAAQDGSLSLLAASVNGSEPSQTFVVTYSDNTTQTFTQGISDWWKPQGYFGESKAITMTKRDLYNGTQATGSFFIYGYTFTLNSTKTLKSITLPSNSHVQVLAMDVAAPADKQAPTTPTNLKTTSVSSASVTLAWTASTDNVAVSKYSVLRNGVAIATVSGTTTSYTNTGLTAGTTYSYTVVAYDAAGNKSAASTALSVTTAPLDKIAPTTPTNLNATSVATTSVTLAWTASTDNVAVTKYSVLRNGVAIATVSGATSYTNTGLTAGTTYSYTVVAYDAAGNKSAASTALSVTTTAPDKTAPSTPANLQMTAVTRTSASIQWDASTDNVGVASYLVYRNGTLVGTVPGALTTFTDSGLTLGTVYSYTVVAADAAGNKSPASAALPVTTSGNPAGAPNIPGAWDLTFSDDFDSLNSNIWASRYWWDGNAGTFATFDPANVSTSNGILSLTANRQQETAINGVTNPYTSGMLNSGGIDYLQPPGFDFTYGYVEARTQIAPGLGMWSALWMLPLSHQDSYEMDVFENLGRAPTTFQGFVHNWPNFGNSAVVPLSFDMTQAYHTYGVDWEPNSVTWYVDGVAVHSYTNSFIVSNQPMYLIFNLDVGGWAGGPNSTSPDSSSWLVDYLRVWQHPGSQNQTLSTTTLASSSNSATVGQPITFTANVATAGSVAQTPTGNVTFMDGTTVLGTAPVDSTGVATLSAALTTAGDHRIKAVYGGNTNLITSTSSALIQTVAPQPTTTTVVASSNPATIGNPVTFTATVSAASGTPTGSVQFIVDGVNSGDPVALVNGSASSAAISDLTLGTHTISVSYSGDANNLASTSTQITQTISPQNDNFANAAVITGPTANIVATNIGATKETGEPNHAGNPGGASLWWTWTAPTDGTLTLDTHGSDFNTVLGVYTGNALSTLTSVGANDDDPAGGTTTSKLTLTVTAGTIYWIAVDGVGGETGNISLNISLT